MKKKKAEGFVVRKSSRMFGVSPRLSGMRIGYCTSCFRNISVVKESKVAGVFTKLVTKGG